jgi:Kef-type K+ transport system membrane component KefB
VSFDIPSLPLTEAGAVFAVLTVAILLAPLLARVLRLPEVVAVVLVGFAVGPTGLGLLERQGVVATLGGAGLLYLMFVAGLELDLDDFIEHRRDSIGFGVLTFVVPMTLGTLVALGLGYDLLPSLLLASCWASHTLVTYPIFQRVGTVRNRAVATSVGATIITDTVALLVLAVVARAYQGALTPVFWATLIPSFLLVTGGAVVGLPRLARWFFSGPGQVRSLRFVFVLVCLFTMSALYAAIGIEAIVGAFLAGLALNRSVPNGGALMERIDFFGSTIFIPLFLLATGMLIDLQVLADPRTLLIGVSFTAVAIVAKLLAAVAAGRVFHYDRAEVGAMFALSSAQAAATLAAVVVGLSVGLIDEDTVNAVIMVILVTCVLASVAASRYAPQLSRPEEVRDLGEVVVVPVANPANAPTLMRYASSFARADGGLVVPVMVVPAETDEERLAQVRALDDEVVAVAQSAGAEARSILRIDTSPEAGIAHTVVEQNASMLIVGWKGGTGRAGASFGGIIDGVLASTFVPTLLVQEGASRPTRVLVVVDASVTAPAGEPAVRMALRTATIVARSTGSRVTVITNQDPVFVQRLTDEVLDGVRVELDERRRSIIVKERARPDDVVIAPSMGDEGRLRGLASRTVRAVPEGATLLVVVDSSLADPRARRNQVGEPGTTAGGLGPITGSPSAGP